MDEEVLSLEEYCPPLDPALVHAIFTDFAGQPESAQLARELLEGLKQTAVAEQLTDFDPSGSSGDIGRSSPSKQGSDELEWNTESSTTHTTTTDYTSLSNELAILSLDGKSASTAHKSLGGGYFEETEEFDFPTKELLLTETFPTLRRDLVAYTLKKCDGDFSKATDELLNHVYFEDSRVSPDEETSVAKGIDAFSEEYHVPQRGRKGKGKRKQKSSYFSNSSSTSISESDMPITSPSNRWQDSSRDVEFIASRTGLTLNAVTSLYHKNGASLRTTIVAIVEKDITSHEKGEPEAGYVQSAVELAAEFPTIRMDHAVALIRLTAPSTANAHELAKALTTSPQATATRTNLKVLPKYTPVDLSSAAQEPSKLPTLPPSATPRTASSLAAARSAAFTQASAAYRKGKSDSLMKAAASYYAQVGRDNNAHLYAVNEADADALVASQSTPTVLDLHGVTVNSATRIASEKAREWWEGLGEERIPGGGRRGVGQGYRIVTGLGRHSEGGRGKLGPAVARTLVKEGWKVEVGSGELVVWGLARRI